MEQELEKKLNKQKNRIGLVGAPLKLREESNAPQNISAFIDPKDWHIELIVNEGFNPTPDAETRAYVKGRNISQPLERMLSDILYHECGHWELPRGSGFGCPYSTELYDEIKDGVARALQEKGKDGKSATSTGQDLESYIANAFSDIVDNLNVSQHTTHSGQMLFWNDQGLCAPEGKFPKFYEAFVKLNLFLFGYKDDQKLLGRFCTSDKEVIEAVQKVINDLGLGRNKEENLQKLFRKDAWNDLAYKFTLATADLLEGQEQLPLSAISESGLEQKMKSGDEIEKIVYGRYTAGKAQSRTLESFEQLDSLYRKLAKAIPIKIETVTESLSFPIAHYGRQNFDAQKHDLRREKVRGFSLDEEGMIRLRISRGEIMTEAGYRRNIRSFPKLKVALVDTSGSMKEGITRSEDSGSTTFIPWGDESKYHYAILGWYGIQNYLVQQGFAPYVDNSLINFSDESIASGRQKPENIHEVKKVLFSPQFGDTFINPQVLDSHLEQDGFLLSISDGEVSNWDDAKDDYKSAVQKVSYAHIQIGSKNKFTRDLERWKIPVYYVNSGEDLSRLMVEVASKHYHDYAFSRVHETPMLGGKR